MAGITRIRERQAVGAVDLIKPSIKFRDDASAPATSQALGSEGGDAGGLNIVPNFYFVAPLSPRWSVGLGVNAPYGLVTDYGDAWIGRFQAIKSSIRTINVNPGVAWKAANNVSLGLELN